MKKLIAILLAVSMIMAFALTASAAETTLPDLDCTGWWTNHTDGVEVTEEGITISFTNTTYESATSNWHGPLYVLYTANNSTLAGYSEYWVQRGDNAGWNAAGNTWANMDVLNAAGITMVGTADNWDEVWANWQTNLKAGCEVKIFAKLEGTNAVVTMEIAGLTVVTTVPVNTDKPVYLALTGEMTKLTNIKVEGAKTSSAKLESTLDCAGWWTAHSEAVELSTTPITLTFTNTTYESATTNWHGPLYVLYTSAGNHIGSYSEYWVQRGDNYGWNATANTFDGMETLNAAGITMVGTADNWDEMWANWQATLKAGCDVKIVAQLEGKNAVITMEMAGLTTVTTVPVDTSKPVYLALTGEMTKLTNIKAVTETGEDAPVVTPDNTNPKDGDTISVFFALMAVSAAGIALLGKKKEF